MSAIQPEILENEAPLTENEASHERLPIVKSPRRVVFFGLVMGLIFDWFFVGNTLGIALPVFTWVLIIGFLFVHWREQETARLGNIGLAIPVLFFSFMAAWRSNDFLTFLNVVSTIVLLTYLTYTYTGQRLYLHGFLGYFMIPVRTWSESLVEGALVLRDGTAEIRASIGRWETIYAILRGLLLAGPVLLIFVALLSAADALFADILGDIFDNFLFRVPEFFLRFMLVALITWVLGGLTVVALQQKKDAEPIRLLSKFTLTFLGNVEAMVIMVLVDILFASFVAVQFSYFFRPVQRIFDEELGVTFSEAARRGFFELVIVACLSLGLILTLHWLSRRENKRQMVAFNGAASFMIGMVLVILVSAFYRLFLYEVSFGFTQLRLYSHLFIVCLAGLLCWTVVVLWFRPQQFATGFFVTAFTFVGLLNLINPDGFIARQNILRYQPADGASLSSFLDEYGSVALDGRVSRSLDAEYLITLPDDAIPAMVEHYDDLSASDRAALGLEFASRLERFEEERQDQPWQSFHIGRLLAYQALQEWAGSS